MPTYDKCTNPWTGTRPSPVNFLEPAVIECKKMIAVGALTCCRFEFKKIMGKLNKVDNSFLFLVVVVFVIVALLVH